MVRNAVHSLLAEPRALQPPKRVWRDWALVAVVLPAAAVEAVLRDDLEWRAVSIVLCVPLALTLLWRRTSPLLAVIAAFGSITLVDVTAIVVGVEWVGLNTMIFVLLLPYALLRWASGREAAIGTVIMMGVAAFSAFDESNGAGDVVGGFLILLFFAAIGTSVRYRDNARLREMEQVKLLEREQLARELHDTVAHHVSAIAVQAQAGRTLAGSRPQAAVDALEIIEEEASRTLVEMRSMVGALRQGDEPDLAPQPGVADIERLIPATGDGPHVEVELAGDLDDLRSSVSTAIYRLAQESITNAIRHARNATRVTVQVAADPESVRLTVRDDGDAVPSAAGSSTGYGLAGMSERAKLLGGTLEAGPQPNRGWRVCAVLPRYSTTR